MKHQVMKTAQAFVRKGFTKSVSVSLAWQVEKGNKSNTFIFCYYAHKYQEETTRIGCNGKALQTGHFRYWDYSRREWRIAILKDIRKIKFISKSEAEEALPSVNEELAFLELLFGSDKAHEKVQEAKMAMA